eukprot:gene357-990_t
MATMLLLICFCLVGTTQFVAGRVVETAASLPNNRPVVGILSQELSPELLPPSIKGNSYIAASYVKYIESAGGRVVPILTNFTSDQLAEIFRSVNGILIPGGGAHIPGSGYFKNAQVMFKMAIEANRKGDYFPIWGTCLGFQTLHLLVDNKLELGQSNAVDIPMPLNFTQHAYRSRMFAKQSQDLMQIFKKKPVTYNFHKHCISKTSYENSEKLKSFFNVLSYNDDKDGKIFVSTTEAQHFPIYGSQWHPEKNPFEWNVSLQMPHSADAIKASESLAEFFVNEARKSGHEFSSSVSANEYLIYKYAPIFTPGEHFEQVYVF